MELTADLARRREAWSSYWTTGAVHSCIGRLVDDREGAIGRFWGAQFARLRDGQRVLDLATGNGAVPKLLFESAVGDVRVDAVDVAALRPAWYLADKHSAITFHSGVAMEALPFGAGEFDMVVSQFGLEYARWPAAIDELARVCTDEGAVALVMHHADSVVVRLGHVEQAYQDALLADDGLIGAAIRLLPHLATVAAGGLPDITANQAREDYNEALRQVAARVGQDATGNLLVEAREHVHSILGGRFGGDADARHAMLLDYRRALDDASIRTRELIACALDEARAESLVTALGERLPGRRLERMALAHAGDVVAWGISAS